MTIGQLRHAMPSAPARHALSKVPEVTLYFWIIKVLTTGMGEAASDGLTHALSPAIAVCLGGLGFAAVLAVQFRVRRYIAWVYWSAVVMVSVFGTMCADVLHVGLGIPYVVSTTFFTVSLAAIFVAWWAVERTLSIHSIFTWRREAFYWLTVVTTFALGTAAGDMTAHSMNLGYLTSGVMFAVLIAVPALAHWKLGLNPIVAFWFAYIVTRPLGASFADWMAVAPGKGGLNLSYGGVTLLWTVAIVGFVAYLALSGKDVQTNR